MKKTGRTGILFLSIFLIGLLLGFALSGCGAHRNASVSGSANMSDVPAAADTSAASSGPEDAMPPESLTLLELPEESGPESAAAASGKVEEGRPYFSRDDVAAYLFHYGELPPNYLTKAEAQENGWIASRGNLWEVTDHGVIGGDRFGNYEGRLPKKKNRKYYECDVNYEGGHRGAERLIYSSDGLIYYTGDHYETFTLLYGEEE